MGEGEREREREGRYQLHQSWCGSIFRERERESHNSPKDGDVKRCKKTIALGTGGTHTESELEPVILMLSIWWLRREGYNMLQPTKKVRLAGATTFF